MIRSSILFFFLSNSFNFATSSNLSSDNVSFYWVDGGDSRQVQFSVTVNSVSNSATATFNVKRPTATVTATTGTVAIDSNFPPGFALHFGNPLGTPGVTFTPSVTIPSGFTGSTEWIQMVNSNRTFQPNVGSQVVLTANGLDTTYPYSFDNSTSDSPGTAFSACDVTSATTNDSFTMWLMFKPDVSSGSTAIWVLLRAVSWSWTGDASRTAGTCSWTLNSSSKNEIYNLTATGVYSITAKRKIPRLDRSGSVEIVSNTVKVTIY